MNQIPIWVFLISFLFIFQTTHSVENDVKTSLISFLAKLSALDPKSDQILDWSLDSDPCIDTWPGVFCDIRNGSIKRLVLDELNLEGTLDTSFICNSKPLATSLAVLSIKGNNLSGSIPSDISNCKRLTHLYINRNKFYGNLPESLPMLSNLKRLDISENNLSGTLPELSRISGMITFLAQNNRFTGEIPQFDFSNIDQFDVSFNNLSGPIPVTGNRFPETSYLGNPDLCGDPLPKKCPPAPGGVNANSSSDTPNHDNTNQTLMYSGYCILGLVCIFWIIFKLCKGNKKEKKVDAIKKSTKLDDHTVDLSSISSEPNKIGRSDYYSMYSSELVSSSLIVVSSPVVNGLKFEDLLRAPAELLGRGKHGSLYKVIFDSRMVLVVKRIKDWAISGDSFMQRMWKIYGAKHPNVLPPLAFYSSKEEKLLVYEYQQNGSLFKLLHGLENSLALDWTARLVVAASIADALAFMHRELQKDGIAHGNLKSSNILIDKNMEPCISEYGLMEISNEDTPNHPNIRRSNTSSFFKEDIYRFGLILLELLTGKPAQNSGVNLADWVNSVVREEWTAEVFDRCLISEGASEERMLNLLQVAIKCVSRSADARPSMNQVAVMINGIKEDEQRSVIDEKSVVDERSIVFE